MWTPTTLSRYSLEVGRIELALWECQSIKGRFFTIEPQEEPPKMMGKDSPQNEWCIISPTASPTINVDFFSIQNKKEHAYLLLIRIIVKV